MEVRISHKKKLKWLVRLFRWYLNCEFSREISNKSTNSIRTSFRLRSSIIR